MLRNEFLVFIDNGSIRCSDAKTFNHLLQSDPDISISKGKLSYRGLTVDYDIKNGKAKNTDNHYFHLTFACSSLEKIEDYNKLLRAVKSVLHITNKAPQTLYDGVSLYYSQLAYPKVFEIENLMRKLITKFMLTNVGIDWIKDRVPDDVKTSINSENKDLTYLHNVDFIQLKNFLFSENYPAHKENLFQKLKRAKAVAELDLSEIKELIPNSNWDKYFSDKVQTSKEKLSKQWDELYELRCRIAHNRSFTKTDFESVHQLCTELKIVIQQAIDNLDKIDISENERELLTEAIAGNFNTSFGEFMALWRDLQQQILSIIKSRVLTRPAEHLRLRRTFMGDVTELVNLGILDHNLYIRIRAIVQVRNQVVHNTDTLTQVEIANFLDEIKSLIEAIKKLTI